MSNYIKIYLDDRNEFRASASFQLNGMYFLDVNVKIDTGCPRTSFPMKRLGLKNDLVEKLKLKDCKDVNIIKQISFGVNDSKEKQRNDKNLFDNKKFEQLNSISFMHRITDFMIDDVSIKDLNVFVSYDRVGNILIGMDILKNMDLHIGKDKDERVVLIGCPYNNINTEYLKALNNLILMH